MAYEANLLDKIDEGIILVDDHFVIRAFNEKAKMITGLKLSSTIRHEAGELKPGDLVLFISNALGSDDGMLDQELLKTLNIKDEKCQQGDIVMGAGLYETGGFDGVYKHLKPDELTDQVTFKGQFVGHDFELALDRVSRNMTIKVDQKSFEQAYIRTYGHMVVLDGQSGQLKFYQDKGYTARHEAIGDLLRGGSFRSKGIEKDTELPLIGQSLESILVSDRLFETLGKLKEDDQRDVRQQLFLDMNQRPVYCIVEKYQLEDGGDQLMIKFRDLSEMQVLLTERESILENIEALKTSMQMVPDPNILKAFEILTGQSQEMVKVKFLAHRASQIKSNVLITGESGTGKTMLARLIHDNSGLKGDFVEVNCAAIPATLFESELFGYEKGAFTGADQKGKKGFFELAEGGTLFLDEIGELPQEIQVKLLQALQSKQFYKLGSSVPTHVKTRIITATNKELFDAVQSGGFRQDLFYRINVYPIKLPSLRERQEDLFLVVRQIMTRLSKEMGIGAKQISQEAYSLLKQHPWPGNIRELENVLERAMAVSLEDTIHLFHLSLSQEELNRQKNQEGSLKDRINAYEKRVLMETLLNTNSHQEAMAELALSKSTFYDKLKKHHLLSS